MKLSMRNSNERYGKTGAAGMEKTGAAGVFNRPSGSLSSEQDLGS